MVVFDLRWRLYYGLINKKDILFKKKKLRDINFFFNDRSVLEVVYFFCR